MTETNDNPSGLPRNCPVCGETALECLIVGERCWPFNRIPAIQESDMRFIEQSVEGSVGEV